MERTHGSLHRIVAERFLLAPRNFTDAIRFGMLFSPEKVEILLRKVFLMYCLLIAFSDSQILLLFRQI
jgi:hypothetical protein